MSVAPVENVEEAPILTTWNVGPYFPLVQGVAFVEGYGVAAVSFSFQSGADEPPEEPEAFPHFKRGLWDFTVS